MSPTRVRVVKVGGSLFDLPDLADRLRGFLQDDPNAYNILVAGGGPLVDQVRKLNEINPLDTERAHWICIDTMSITARLLADRLGIDTIVDVDDLPTADTPRTVIFDASRWLRHIEPTAPGTKLPIGWQVTSDSIAGRLAIVLKASELVLCKSALPASTATLCDLAAAGYVDSHLPALQAELPPMTFVNLRELPHRTVALAAV